MKRLSLALCAAALVLAASSQAQASYQVVRWHITGMCQIWNYNLPLPKFPTDYRRMSPLYASYGAAERRRVQLVRSGACW
jgi:hypothetical protein